MGKKGKGSIIMTITNKDGNLLGILVDFASPYEVTRVLDTIDEMFVDQLPEHLNGDAAYGSDRLDKNLSEVGVEMIALHKVTERRKLRSTVGNLDGMFDVTKSNDLMRGFKITGGYQCAMKAN